MNSDPIIHPIDIAGVTLRSNLVLAPMAGFNDLPFRLLAVKNGAGLVVTEMVSAKAITYHNKNTVDLLVTDPAERPVSVQLFGSDPAAMEEAAAYVAELPFDIIDINMGCPVKKIVCGGDGSALARDPKKAAEVAAAVVRGVSSAAPQDGMKKPATAKIRAGWDEAHINAVEVALALEEAGVSMIAVHGRTKDMMYRGSSDNSIIAKVKEALSIPVFGNGDLKCADDVRRMYEETGVDGFMIGRAARGNPWIFRQIENEIILGKKEPLPDQEEVADTVIWHLNRLVRQKGERVAVNEMRKQASFYTAGRPGTAALRRRINEAQSASELTGIIQDWRSNALPC